MSQRRFIPAGTVLATILFMGCGKEEMPAPPAIGLYRTYDLVTVDVKEDPLGGYLLLCKNTPLEQRTGFVQRLLPDGGLAERIDLTALPRTVENVSFQEDEIVFTDLIPRADGSLIVIGLARQIDLDDRLHLVVHVIDRQQRAVIPSFRRFLVQNATMQVNISGEQQDIDGLPLNRAIGALRSNGALVVAARHGTSDQAGVALFQFPIAGGGVTAASSFDMAVSDRLNAMACDPVDGRTIVVTDVAAGNDHHTKVRAFTPLGTVWAPLDEGQYGPMNLDPTMLVHHDGEFLMVGNAPDPENPERIKPFVSRFNSASAISGTAPVLNGIAGDEQAVASYCATWRNGALQLMTNFHQASTNAPFFNGDITSDLSVTEVTWPGLSMGASTTIIPGQGLRPIGHFAAQGMRVVIGSQHPYLNAGYTHTFFLTIET